MTASASIFDLKMTCREKFAPKPDTAVAQAYSDAMGWERIPGISLGKTRVRTTKDFKLLVLVSDNKHMPTVEKIRREAAGEIVLMQRPKVAEPRVTAEFNKQTHRKKFNGAQAHSQDKGFVGSWGFTTPSAEDPDVELYHTCSHVAGIRELPGHLMEQGDDIMGPIYRNTGIPIGGPFKADECSTAIRKGTRVYWEWDFAFKANLRGYRAPRDSDINRPSGNNGQTIGSKTGHTIGIEIDDLPIGYSDGVAWGQDMSADVREGGFFSQGGHSGTLRVAHDLRGTGMVTAGGPDRGVDVSYSTNVMHCIAAGGGLARLVT